MAWHHKCHLCESKFSTMKSLTSNLQTVHNLVIKTETHNFVSHDEFIKWKLNEEENCKSYFVQHSSNRMHGDNKYQYLCCNRSGKVRLRGKGIRHIKTQGSCKTGMSCIANMRVLTVSQVLLRWITVLHTT
uniref:C2H2-type domain-containing protein n=1 Tax=Amphimedon queenslandica TaxID=400682 RepID=A0A1X7UUG7_AMPQE